MKYVTCMGAVYKLSDRAYKKALRELADGKGVDLDLMGNCIVEKIECDVTDMDREEAQMFLDDLKL